MALLAHDTTTPYVTIEFPDDPAGLYGVLFERRLMTFEYLEESGKRPQIAIEFDNADGEIADLGLLCLGLHMQITYGYAQLRSQPINVHVRKINATPGKSPVYSSPGAWSVVKFDTALDKPKLHWRPEGDVGMFRNMTIDEIIKQIARRANFDERKIFVQNTQGLIDDHTRREEEISIQDNETVEQFARRMAGEYGFRFFVRNNEFHWHQEDYHTPNMQSIEYFYGPDLLEFSISGDYSVNVTKVTGGARDWKKRVATAISTKGISNILRLPETMNMHDVLTTIPDKVKMATARRILLHDANKWKIDMSCIGDPRFYRGAAVDLRSFGAFVDGKWVVRGLRQTIDSSGFTTNLVLRRMRTATTTARRIISTLSPYGVGSVSTGSEENLGEKKKKKKFKSDKPRSDVKFQAGTKKWRSRGGSGVHKKAFSVRKEQSRSGGR